MNDIKLPLVVVRWHDAWVRAEEPATLTDAAQAHKPEVITTIGWVLQNDEQGIQLANEYYDGCFRGRTFIYKPMIVSITPYNLSKPRAGAKKANESTNTATPIRDILDGGGTP